MDSDSWSRYLNRPATLDEERLYYHFRSCITKESPYQVIERFRKLFIDACGYSDHLVWQSLTRITDPAHNVGVDQDFKFILNRCCYTLINSWQLQHQDHSIIPKLINLFETLPSEVGYSPTTKRIRKLVRRFVGTEHYAALRRLPQVLFEANGGSDWEGDQPLGTLLQRYPYLYEHCLLTRDSGSEQKQNVHQMRDKAQREFETDLARYENYRTGRLRLESIQNPTLLSNSELNEALDHYLGNVDGHNHRDAAKRFIVDSRLTRSYREFKEELSDYLIGPLLSADSKYTNQFKRKLRKDFLQDILSDADSQPINNFLLNETCRKLLNFLIIESRLSQHHTFIDLVSNVGHTLTIELLLRIALFCRTIKPWLEQRFAILFAHYETSKRSDMGWLVVALEHINIALSTNFGGVSFQTN